jgi:aspartyl-tRNA(Asn)/glutamyl-tRNA(Gln) amidotransferase subunit C
MKITREDVKRVAELAHIELTTEEMDSYGAQLDEILGYIGKLSELDTTNVEPMAQLLYEGAGQGAPVMREDVIRPADVAGAILKQAPEAKEPYFRVPRVIER